MYSLISHMAVRFNQLIENERKEQGSPLLSLFNKEQMKSFWNSKSSKESIESLRDHIARKEYAKLQSVFPFALMKFPEKATLIHAIQSLSFDELKPSLLHPTTHAWLRAFYGHSINVPAHSVSEKDLPVDVNYFECLLSFASTGKKKGFSVLEINDWYGHSLGDNILLNHPPEVYESGLKNLHEALDIIRNYNIDLYKEILLVSPNILLVKDITAHPDKDVSFSDETLPGALFIGVWKSDGLLSPYMVAASLIHEHLHQKLYLLQQRFELFLPQETLIFSPWPQTLRPPAGALHAVYVFTHVATFWNEMLRSNQEPKLATSQLEQDLERLEKCINEIKEKVLFTTTGQLFFDSLLEEYRNLTEQSLLQGV